MKWRFIVTIMLIAFINAPVWAGTIDKNEAYLGVQGEQLFSDDDTVQGYTLQVPYLSHTFESTLNDSFGFYVYTNVDFTLSKLKSDDEAGNAFNLSLDTELEWWPTSPTYLNEALIVSFSNYKAGFADAERENWMDLTSLTVLGYSVIKKDLEGISPWASFQKGFKVEGSYARQLYAKDAGEKVDEKDHYFGLLVRYAYFDEPNAFMIKPEVIVEKHLNDMVDESLNIAIITNVAKDFSTILTGTTDIGLNIVKADSDADTETEFAVAATLYLNMIEKIELFAGVTYMNSLTDDEADPAYGFMVGLEYELFAKSEE